MLTRMPDFHISDYKDAEFNSYRFIGADAKAFTIEGHKYYIEYRLNNVASLVPVASNDKEEGRAKNRRVELVRQ